MCQGKCVDLDKDRNNCAYATTTEIFSASQQISTNLIQLGGKCNRVCNSDTQVCKNGKCATRASQPCKAGRYLEGGQCYEVLCNTAFTGFYVGGNSAIDIYDCARQCSDYKNCIYAAFTPSTSQCAFNSQLGNVQTHPGLVSAELVDISRCS